MFRDLLSDDEHTPGPSCPDSGTQAFPPDAAVATVS